MVAKPVTVGVVGVIVLASALVLNYFVLPGEESEPATKVAAPAAPPAAPPKQPDKSEKQASKAPAGKSSGPVEAAAPPEQTTPPKPSFDVVRVDPDGNTVIAGRGTPNTEIAIVDGDNEIGRVTSDDRGEWVFVPPSKLSPGQRVLTLKELGAGKAESSEAVVLVIPEKGKDIAGRASSEPSVPLAVVVPKDDSGDERTAARVLQAPAAGPLASSPTASDKPTAGADAAATRVAAAEPGTPSPSGAAAPASSAAGTPAAAGTAPAGNVASSQQPTAQTAARSEATAVASAGAGPADGSVQRGAALSGAAPSTTTSSVGAPAATSSTPGTQAAPVVPAAPSAGSAPVPAQPSQLASAAPVVSAYPEAKPAAPAEAAEDAKKEVAVDVIDYDDKGDVVFSGRAEPGSRVEVFIDNRKVGHTGADTEGRWTMRPAEPVAPGSYQLRVDKVAPSGTVQARVAFPFVRADPLTDLPNNRLVVIQPGNNLWRIATRVYGSGYRFVEIFDANKDQILDPDLIYPGQVFGLPRVN